MPEIKHNFTGGKMNKDVDQRLVPKGEYRDAMNIQVSTSEGSDVGTVQNILGNSTVVADLGIDSNSLCVGAVADEKNDALYWFVREPIGISEPRDIIFELKNGYIKKVFVDYKLESGGVLKFPENIITGINIIDDMLFWTDGQYDIYGELAGSEPKKINITRSIEGTFPNGNFHTRLINPDQNINFGSGILIQEEHITVTRKAPKNVLTIATEVDKISTFLGTTYPGVSPFLVNPSNPVQGNVVSGGTITVYLLYDPSSDTPLAVGDVLVFNPISSSSLPNDEHQVSAILTNKTNDGSTDVMFGGVVLLAAGTYTVWEMDVINIDTITPTAPEEYNWAVQTKDDESFKNKFPRFSYRYKYEDSEYSSFAPFTSVVFEPKNFKYDVKEAFNLGMENAITKITLSNYNLNIPSDVVSIDLLYKESNSPVIYTVDTLDSLDSLTSLTHSYGVKPNQIRAVVPGNQLLRVWDNVPRTSIAQEITGNRIVYGNYLQNYNLQENPKLLATLVDREDCDDNHKYKSLKSIRNYSLGISYLDEYGRQTPVFTNKQADVEIPIDKSDSVNQVSSRVLSNTPDWAKYYKVFVKETSSEYYNLAMDRVYDARDGNIWLSFPSSERNKVDDETFLILKKGVEGAQPVDEKNKYKILAIENEAPDFIKTKQWYIAEAKEDPSTNVFDFFTDINGYPIENSRKININKTNWDALNIPLSDIESMCVKFSREVGTQTQFTVIYYVTGFHEETSGTLQYMLTLDKTIKEEYLNDPSNAAQPDPSIGIVVYKKEMRNSPEFDGRFFVKVARDIIIDQYIVSQATTSLITEQTVTTQLPFYYLADQSNPVTGDNTTSSIVGGNADTQNDWTALFDPENLGTTQSMWFIDAAYYKGYYENDGTLQNYGMLGADNFAKSGPNPNNPSELNGAGYNKGIYTESGQTYIDLSFGYVKAADGAGNTSGFGYAMHSDGTDSTRVQSSLDSLLDNYVPNAGTSDYYWQEMKDGFSHGDGFGGTIAQATNSNNLIKHWKIGSSLNTHHNTTQNAAIVSRLQQNQKFIFAGDPDATVYQITGNPEVTFHLNYRDLRDYYDELYTLLDSMFVVYYPDYNGSDTSYTFGQNSGYIGGNAPYQQLQLIFDEMNKASKAVNKRVTWKIPIEAVESFTPNDPTASNSSFNPLNSTTGADATNIGTIQFVDVEWLSVDDQVVSEDPAIWETEPKQDTDLDIYYEIDGTFPLEINNDTNYLFAPIGSTVSIPQPTSAIPMLQPGTTVVGWDGNVVELSLEANNCDINQYMTVVFSRPDGSCVEAELLGLFNPTDGPCDTSFFLNINPDVSNRTVKHSWFNCYSFRNGVESDRIRDDYNQVRIDKGAKASSTLDKPYKEEHRKYGLIYSGIYNSTSGVNNLNQFIAAEKITKDINPIYGSIQKLYAGWGQGGDLIALCEDRVLKILANKDALYNADGDSNVTSTNNVLGQAIPYSGEYGISKNPESFASEAYRIYFTDKVRGTVMRLSMDGLTPISNHGMKDWFRDHLKLGDKLIGSYDDKKDEYNITIKGNTIAKTVTFKEDVKGWVSFKSFTPENAISCANEYYTFKDGNIWKHHDELVNRNTFYNQNLVPSSVEVIFNEVPGSVKSFKTVNYEGSQAKVTSKDENGVTLVDGEYFNLSDVDGWHVIAKDGVQGGVVTNLERGGITEFIKKEGKWFGYVIGDDVNINALGNISDTSNYDTEDFSIQGVGRTANVVSGIVFGCMDDGGSTNLDVFGDGSNIVGVFANPSVPGTAAFNYISAATNDNGSCVDVAMGCIDFSAQNFDGNANTDDGSCIYPGCTIPLATITSEMSGGGSLNFDPNANFDDGSCVMATYGCTLVGFANTNIFADFGSAVLQTAGTFCGWENCMCIPFNYGCTDPNASNPPSFVDELTDINTDDGSCLYNGCTDPLSADYDFMGSTVDGPNGALAYLNGNAFDDGSCTYVGGCTDATACNFDANAQTDDGTCYLCGDNNAVNYVDASGNVPSAPDYTCMGACAYCEEVASVTITNQTTSDPGLNNGTVTIEWPASASASYYEISDVSGVVPSVSHNASGNATETLTITGLGTGTYTFYVLTYCYNTDTGIEQIAGYNLPGGVFGIGQYGAPFTTTITTTLTIGCIDNGSSYAGGVVNPAGGTWGACNFDLTANADASGVIGGTDYSNCNYTDCVGCNDSSYVEYCGDCWDPLNFVNGPPGSGYDQWVSDTVPTSCTTLIVYGCTDAAALNYDATATNDDGSCVMPVYGCTDSTLNNDGTYAASNYNSLANTDDGSCNPYNCPTIQITQGLYNTGFRINTDNTIYPNSSTYWVNSGTNATIDGSVVTMGPWSHWTPNGAVIGVKTSEPTANYFAAGSTTVDIVFNVVTSDGNCSITETQTFTIGCVDAAADNTGSFNITDDTQCMYTGCTDASACNFDFAADSTHTDDGSCYSCGDPNAYNYDGNGVTYLGCNANCTYTGCTDNTPTTMDAGVIAATNYNSNATIPCNSSDPLQGFTGPLNPALDNDCCQYDNQVSNSYIINNSSEDFNIYYEPEDSAYTTAEFTTITIGDQNYGAFNTLTNTYSQGNMGPGASSRLVNNWGLSDWQPYIYNNNVRVEGTWIADGGNIDNASLSDVLPQTTDNVVYNFSVGCKNDSTAANYNASLDLHLDGSCVAVNSGCMDASAWPTVPSNNTATAAGLSGYDAAYNTACGTSGSTTNTSCCCFNTACDVFSALGATSYNSGNKELTIPITLIPCARKYQYATRHYDGGWSSWSTATDVPATQTTLGNIKENVAVLWPTVYDNNSVAKQIKVRAVCTDANPTTYSPYQQANVTYTY